jgi:hypothetical protein
MSAGDDKRRVPRTNEPVGTTSVRRIAPPSGASPGSERHVYRAGDEAGGIGDGGQVARRRSRAKPAKRTPILAIVALVLVAVAIALTGLAARDGGLAGSESEPGAFKLLPITTTTT